MKTSTPISLFVFTILCGAAVSDELPPEMKLWDGESIKHPIRYDGGETVRSPDPAPGSPSGKNRVFSYIAEPTYFLHRPERPNGVGLVVCPGGGYRDVWLDREGHDLAIQLKNFGITSMVLKYRTNSGPNDDDRAYSWKDYLPAVQTDARQAIRVFRKRAREWGVDANKVGIGGFSAGGNLALLTALFSEPKSTETRLNGMPDFAGLFYPWFRDEDYGSWIKSRMAPQSAARPVCPMFIMNARDDRATPANKCVEFYAKLLESGVNAELHIYNKGSHGFDLGNGRGHAPALWTESFVAWLRDLEFIDE